MLFTSWLTALLRAKKRQVRQSQSLQSSVSERSGWYQVDQLEDRTLLSAVDLAIHYDGSGYTEVTAVESDASGNMYVLGEFRGTVDFDPGAGVSSLTSTTPNGGDTFLTKLDVDGNFQWVRRFSASIEISGNDLALDSSGNIFVTGGYDRFGYFETGSGTFQLTGKGNGDTFILKMDNSGTLQWAQGLGNSKEGKGTSITVGENGNIYSIGTFSGSVDFADGPATQTLTSSVLFATYIIAQDTSGNLLWSNMMESAYSMVPESIGVDSGNEVYLTGSFQTNLNVDPMDSDETLIGSGNREFFLVNIDNSGDFDWAFKLGNNGIDWGTSLQISADDEIYVGGYFSSTVDFDPGVGDGSMTSGGFLDAFVAKYTTAGNYVWAKQMPSSNGSSYIYLLDLALDASENIYSTGYFRGTADLDPGGFQFNVTSTGDWDPFFSMLDTNGNFLDAAHFETSTRGEGKAIAVGGVGNVLLGGLFEGTIDVDPGASQDLRNSNGNVDGLVLKIPSVQGVKADAGGPYRIHLGENTVLDASLTTHPDEDPATLTYEWDLDGDGIFGETGANALNGDETGINPVFSTANITTATIKTIELRVTDSLLETDTVSTTVEVIDVIPELDWVKTFGGGSSENAKHVKLDAFGNVYIAGQYYVQFDADPGAGESLLPHAGSSDIFVSKFDATGNFLWAKNISGSQNESVQDIGVDSDGNLFLVGYFAGTVDFDPGAGTENRTSMGGDDNYAMKLDADGNLLWVNTIGGLSDDFADGLRIDENGNLIVAGSYMGTVDVDPGLGTDNRTAAEVNSLISKYNPDGELLWAVDFRRSNGASSGGSEAWDVDVDNSENVYVTGYFNGTVDFDPGSGVVELESTTTEYDLYVVKLTPMGQLTWVRAFHEVSGGTNQIPWDIKVDDAQNVYTTGRFSGIRDFDPGSGEFNLTSNGSSDAYVSKLDMDGNFAWAIGIGSASSDNAYDLAVAPGGDVYAVGYTNGLADFDPGPGSFIPENDGAFLAKYNSSGQLQWATSHSSRGYGVAQDYAGNIYQVGTFEGTVDFAPGVDVQEATSNSFESIFLRKLGTAVVETDLEITKTSPGVLVEQGAPLTYTVAAENLGPSDSPFSRIKDDPSAFLDNINWTAVVTGGAVATLSGTGPIDEMVDLPVNATITYTITGTVKPNVRENITNVATIESAPVTDTDPTNNRAFDSDFIVLAAEGGSGYFVDSGQALGFAKSHDAELGDLDGDGDLDIVIGNTFDASEIWFNDGQGNYTNSGQALSASTGVSLGDLDGDGDLDIFLVNGFDGVNYDEVWLNDGSGFFQHSGQTISTVDDCIVKLGDLDGDGDLDAFIGGSTSNGVILLNDGNAHFTDSGQVLLSTLQEYRFGVDLGDLDGDGDLDAFMVSTSGGEVVFLNDGTGVFSEHQALEVAPRAISVNLGDVDSDGDLDAVIADYVDADILLLNDGTGTFTLGQYLPHVPNDKWEADFADIDNDGDLDIFVSGDDARTNFVWLNDGLGHFTDSGQRLTDGGGVGLALGDVDGDNDIDAVVSVYYDAELGNRIWLNQNITLPYSNDFETAGWKGLYAKTPQLFSLVENTGNHSFQVDNSGLTGLGAAVLPLEDPLPGAFEMSAIITSIPGANRWFDGFLIFDYVNDNDFKYAGFFTGQNQWVIGHFQGDFNNRLAQVDWDNEGRTINTNTPYAVHVRIDGEMVYLSVDGEYITEAMFAAPVTGGQIGLAGYNAVTQFDNFIVDEKVSQGSSSLLPYAEDFNDEIANNLAFVGENRWGIYTDSGDKSLIFNGRNNYGLGVAYLDTEFPMPDQYEIVAKVKSNSTANVWYDGFLIFDYQGPNDFKYAGMFVGQNQWVIGHYQGNWNDRIAQFDMDDVGGSINADQEYTLFVTVNGDNVELFVDGLKRVEGTFVGGIAKGSAGVATYNGWTGFDDLEISESVSYGKPVEIPFSEDFEDVVANDFYYNRPNYWKTVSPGDQNLLRVNTSYNNLLAVAHVPLNPVTAPDSFILSADIRSNPVASGWTNGFIIFDYKHDNDFKYAGFFTGQNEWVIGHYQGDWDTRLAEVDWDNEGRSINTKQWYHLEVEIEQDIAKLIVDGEVLAEADFDVPLNQGAVGLAADRAFTWFDNFAIQSFPPPGAPLFSSGDLLFANWDEEQDELLI